MLLYEVNKSNTNSVVLEFVRSTRRIQFTANTVDTNTKYQVPPLKTNVFRCLFSIFKYNYNSLTPFQLFYLFVPFCVQDPFAILFFHFSLGTFIFLFLYKNVELCIFKPVQFDIYFIFMKRTAIRTPDEVIRTCSRGNGAFLMFTVVNARKQ